MPDNIKEDEDMWEQEPQQPVDPGAADEEMNSDPGKMVDELETNELEEQHQDIDEQEQPDIPEDNESLEDNQIDNAVDPEQLAVFQHQLMMQEMASRKVKRKKKRKRARSANKYQNYTRPGARKRPSTAKTRKKR